MMGISIEDKIPKPILWGLAVPSMILLFPLGVLYSLYLLYSDLKDGDGFVGFKRDGFYAMLRPGFYLGLFLSIVFLALLSIPMSLFEKFKLATSSK